MKAITQLNKISNNKATKEMIVISCNTFASYLEPVNYLNFDQFIKVEQFLFELLQNIVNKKIQFSVSLELIQELIDNNDNLYNFRTECLQEVYNRTDVE